MAVASRRTGWQQRLADLLDLPRDVVLDLPRISVIGDLQLLVQNHRGVLEYAADRVVIAMRHGRLVVRGEDLTIGTVNPEEITITGQLAAIEFQR